MRILIPAVLAILLSTSSAIAASNDTSLTQLPPETASSSQDKLVNDILAVSGMRKGLESLPSQVVGAAKQTPSGVALSDEAQNMVANSITDAFPKDGFINRVTASLKNKYNQQRYAHLLQMLSTPLAKRMADLEAREPSPTDLKNFTSQINSHPFPPQRFKLLQRMDADTGSSDLMTRIALISLETNALTASDGCSRRNAEIKDFIEKLRPSIEQSTRNTALLVFAYIYRDVSDEDLQQYLKIYEDKDAKWVQSLIESATDEEFKSGISKATEKIRQYALAHQPKKTMFAPKCPSDKTIAKKDARLSFAEKKKSYPKPGRDLRECLRFDDSAKVIACTENFHT